MLHHRLRAAPRVSKTLAFTNLYATSAASTITIPATAQAGDLAVLYDLARNSSGTPTLVTPAGWTTLSDLTGGTGAAVLSYKILVAGDPGGTVTGMDGTSADAKSLVVFRATPTLAGVAVQDLGEQYTTDNPGAQTLAAQSAYPYVVYGGCGGLSALPTWASAWYSNTGSTGYQRYAFQIFNASGESRSVDCNDSGTGTFLQSCVLRVT